MRKLRVSQGGQQGAGDDAEGEGDAQADAAALVGPQHQQIEGIGQGGDEAEGFHAPAVGGQEGGLKGFGVFGQETEVPAQIPAGHDGGADGQAAE
jgi:hypothetical protein